MENKWCEQLLRCTEELYVLEEESKKIVWVSSYINDGLTSCVGEPCWKAFLGRDTVCPFCPKLSEQDGVYVWDYFDPVSYTHLDVNKRQGVVFFGFGGALIIINAAKKRKRKKVQKDD